MLGYLHQYSIGMDVGPIFVPTLFYTFMYNRQNHHRQAGMLARYVYLRNAQA